MNIKDYRSKYIELGLKIFDKIRELSISSQFYDMQPYFNDKGL